MRGLVGQQYRDALRLSPATTSGLMTTCTALSRARARAATRPHRSGRTSRPPRPGSARTPAAWRGTSMTSGPDHCVASPEAVSERPRPQPGRAPATAGWLVRRRRPRRRRRASTWTRASSQIGRAAGCSAAGASPSPVSRTRSPSGAKVSQIGCSAVVRVRRSPRDGTFWTHASGPSNARPGPSMSVRPGSARSRRSSRPKCDQIGEPDIGPRREGGIASGDVIGRTRRDPPPGLRPAWRRELPVPPPFGHVSVTESADRPDEHSRRPAAEAGSPRR